MAVSTDGAHGTERVIVRSLDGRTVISTVCLNGNWLSTRRDVAAEFGWLPRETGLICAGVLLNIHESITVDSLRVIRTMTVLHAIRRQLPTKLMFIMRCRALLNDGRARLHKQGSVLFAVPTTTLRRIAGAILW